MTTETIISTELVEISADLFAHHLSAYNTGLTEEVLKREYQRHTADSYNLKSDLQNSLRSVLTLLDAENVVPALKVSVVLTLVEGIQNCTPGFHNRVIQSLMSLNVVRESLDDLLYHIRQNLVERASIEFLPVAELGNQVHQHNQFFNLAAKKYGVLPVNTRDPYRGNERSNFKIEEKLARTFANQYRLFGVLHGLQSQCEIVFDYSGPKSPDKGGYAAGNYLPLVELFNKIIVNKPAGLFTPEHFCIFNEDFVCTDIHWSNVNKLLYQELKEHEYLKMSHDEDAFMMSLMNEDELFDDLAHNVFRNIINHIDDFIRCLLFFRHASHSRKKALMTCFILNYEYFDNGMIEIIEQVPGVLSVLDSLPLSEYTICDTPFFLTGDKETMKNVLMRTVNRGDSEAMDFILAQLKKLPEEEITNILLELTNEQDDSRNILMMAISSKNVRMIGSVLNVVKTLSLANQRTILKQKTPAGSGLWLWAASIGHIDIIQMIYEILESTLDETSFRNCLTQVNQYGFCALSYVSTYDLNIVHVIYDLLTSEEQSIQLQQITRAGDGVLANALFWKQIDAAQFILNEMLRYDLFEAINNNLSFIFLSMGSARGLLMERVKLLPFSEKKIKLLLSIIHHMVSFLVEPELNLSLFTELKPTEKNVLIKACLEQCTNNKERATAVSQLMMAFNDSALLLDISVHFDLDFFLEPCANDVFNPIMAVTFQGNLETLRWHLTHLAQLSLAEQARIWNNVVDDANILLFAMNSEKELISLLIEAMVSSSLNDQAFSFTLAHLHMLDPEKGSFLMSILLQKTTTEHVSHLVSMAVRNSIEEKEEDGRSALFHAIRSLDESEQKKVLIGKVFDSVLDIEQLGLGIFAFFSEMPDASVMDEKSFFTVTDKKRNNILMVAIRISKYKAVEVILEKMKHLDIETRQTILTATNCYGFDALSNAMVSKGYYYPEYVDLVFIALRDIVLKDDLEGIIKQAIINGAMMNPLEYLLETSANMLFPERKDAADFLKIRLSLKYLDCSHEYYTERGLRLLDAFPFPATKQELCFMAEYIREEGAFHFIHKSVHHDLDPSLRRALLLNHHVPFSLVALYLENSETSQETLNLLFDPNQTHLQVHLQTYFRNNSIPIFDVYERANVWDSDMRILNFMMAFPDLDLPMRISLINNMGTGPNQLTLISNNMSRRDDLALEEIIALSTKTRSHHDLHSVFRPYIESNRLINPLVLGLQQQLTSEQDDRKKVLFEQLHMKAYIFVIKSILHPDKSSQYDAAAEAVLTLYDALNKANDLNEVQRSIQVHRHILNQHHKVEEILCGIIDVTGTLFGVTDLAAVSPFRFFKTTSSIILDEIEEYEPRLE